MIDTGNHDPSEAVQVGSKFSNDLLLASKRTAHVPSFDQRMGLCSVHNKIRSVQNLHFDADGHYKCTPSSVCALGQREKQRKRSLGNGMMSNHKGHTNYSEMLANSGGSYGREAENSVRLSSQFSNPSCSPHHPPLATMSGFFDVSAYTPLNCSNKNPSVVHTGTLMGRDISSQNMSTSMNQSVGGSYQNLALAPSPGGSMYGSMLCQNTCSPPGYPSHGLMGSCSRPALNHHRLLVPSLPKVQEELDRTTRDLVTNSNKLGPTLRTTIPCAGEPGCLQETQALYRDGNYHRIMERNKVHCADHASAVSYTPHTGLTLAGEHPPVPFDRTQCTQMARSTRALHAAARTSHRHVTKLSVLENSSVEKHICVVHQKQRLAMYMLASPELGGWVCRPEHTCCVSRTERYNTNGKSSSGPDKREDERLDVPERDSATSELFLSSGEDIATSSETKKKRL